jgi:hypothetical protein
MRYVKLLVLGGAVVLGLLALLPEPSAEAQIGCCRVLPDGTAVSATPPAVNTCNLSPAQTRRLAAGRYEVDFTPISDDVEGFLKFVTCDTINNFGATTCELGTAGRDGDASSVFVRTTNAAGADSDRGFNVCVIGY